METDDEAMWFTEEQIIGILRDAAAQILPVPPSRDLCVKDYVRQLDQLALLTGSRTLPANCIS